MANERIRPRQERIPGLARICFHNSRRNEVVRTLDDGMPVFVRRALAAGCLTLKIFRCTGLGPSTPPREAWLPPIAC